MSLSLKFYEVIILLYARVKLYREHASKDGVVAAVEAVVALVAVVLVASPNISVCAPMIKT